MRLGMPIARGICLHQTCRANGLWECQNAQHENRQDAGEDLKQDGGTTSQRPASVETVEEFLLTEWKKTWW